MIHCTALTFSSNFKHTHLSINYQRFCLACEFHLLPKFLEVIHRPQLQRNLEHKFYRPKHF